MPIWLSRSGIARVHSISIARKPELPPHRHSGIRDVFIQKLGQCVPNSGVDNASECDSFMWIDGNTYTSNNNTATWTLTNVVGCDSVVTLNLTINTVDVSATQLDELTIQANTSGAQYQWLDCDNSFALIPGETGQSFTASQNGNYAVQVIQNGCTDTSACMTITNVGIIENDFGEALIVSPNPTNGEVTVSLGNTYSNIVVKIIDIKGKLINTYSFNQTDQLTIFLDGIVGFYIMDVTASGKQARIKILKR